MGKLLAIARNTFVQTLRQSIYLILVLATFAVLVLDVPMAGWTMGESGGDYHDTDQKLLINLGLGTLLTSGLLLAAFSASAALSREIEDRTALTVVSKPVPRATFVLGKFLGVAAAVLLAYYLCTLVLLMTVRHQVMPAASDPYDMPVIVLGCSAAALALLLALGGNFFFGWPFSSAAVWSMVACLSLAMGLICFLGKDWKLVPPGYDTPPQASPDQVRIELKPGQSYEAFSKKLEAANCFVRRSEGGACDVDFSEASLSSLAGSQGRYDPGDPLGTAVRAFAAWPEVARASEVVNPPVITRDLLAGVLLILMGVVVLVAVAVSASTQLGQAMTLLVCAAAMGVGSIHPFLGNWSQYLAVRLLGWMVPDLTYYYSMDALSRPIAVPIPASFLLLAGAYTVLYVAGLLAVGVALFQGRQMDATAASSTMPGAVSLLAGLGRAAALVVGFAALVLLSIPAYYTARGLLAISALILGAAWNWVLWTGFGRGSRWSYWFVLAAAVLGVVIAAGGLVLPAVREGVEQAANPVLVVLSGLAALLTLAVCLFPKTRRHFHSHAA